MWRLWRFARYTTGLAYIHGRRSELRMLPAGRGAAPNTRLVLAILIYSSGRGSIMNARSTAAATPRSPFLPYPSRTLSTGDRAAATTLATYNCVRAVYRYGWHAA